MQAEYNKIIKGLRTFSLRIHVVVWMGKNDMEMISVDTNHFENRAEQYHFCLKTV